PLFFLPTPLRPDSLGCIRGTASMAPGENPPMSIVFACSCGKQLQTSVENAGHRFQCPACGQVLVAPGPSPAAPATVRFACACGKKMEAGREHAGQRARCPQCGQIVVIPGGAAPYHQQGFPGAGSAPTGPWREERGGEPTRPFGQRSAPDRGA